jgi:hypothetical protein
MNCYSYEATRSEVKDNTQILIVSLDVRTLNPSETAVSNMTGIEMKLVTETTGSKMLCGVRLMVFLDHIYAGPSTKGAIVLYNTPAMCYAA